MQDHELYRRILGIEAPWQVERVELKLQQGEVHVYLAHQDNREWACANGKIWRGLFSDWSVNAMLWRNPANRVILPLIALTLEKPFAKNLPKFGQAHPDAREILRAFFFAAGAKRKTIAQC